MLILLKTQLGTAKIWESSRCRHCHFVWKPNDVTTSFIGSRTWQWFDIKKTPRIWQPFANQNGLHCKRTGKSMGNSSNALGGLAISLLWLSLILATSSPIPSASPSSKLQSFGEIRPSQPVRETSTSPVPFGNSWLNDCVLFSMFVRVFNGVGWVQPFTTIPLFWIAVLFTHQEFSFGADQQNLMRLVCDTSSMVDHSHHNKILRLS